MEGYKEIYPYTQGTNTGDPVALPTILRPWTGEIEVHIYRLISGTVALDVQGRTRGGAWATLWSISDTFTGHNRLIGRYPLMDEMRVDVTNGTSASVDVYVRE